MHQLNDTIDYSDVAAMDDRQRDDWRMALARQDHATYDTGGELTIGWMYGADGSRLSQDYDDVFSDHQPHEAISI